MRSESAAPPELDPWCDLCRRREAIGRLDGEPRCAECVELELERGELAFHSPELARSLPSLVDVARGSP